LDLNKHLSYNLINLYKIIKNYFLLKNWIVSVINKYGDKRIFYSSMKKREDAIIDVISKIEDNQLMNDIDSVNTIPLNINI
tara:strand:- start:149 stop:391 length:243 start_codon:yes stop_codon:yes gene_type:complete